MTHQLKCILLFLIFASSGFCQSKQILLTNKNDNDTEFFRENQRVKIQTNDGKKHFGRIQIIDDVTVSIDNILIPMASIVKIRSMSFASAFFSATFLIVGAFAIVAGAFAGGYGLLLVPPGVLLTTIGALIPSMGDSHKNQNWTYQIVQNKQSNAASATDVNHQIATP